MTARHALQTAEKFIAAELDTRRALAPGKPADYSGYVREASDALLAVREALEIPGHSRHTVIQRRDSSYARLIQAALTEGKFVTGLHNDKWRVVRAVSALEDSVYLLVDIGTKTNPSFDWRNCTAAKINALSVT